MLAATAHLVLIHKLHADISVPPDDGSLSTKDRLQGVILKQTMPDNPIAHKRSIDKHGQELPEIGNWKWKPDTE